MGDKYRIEKLLGEGGMGVVVEAYHIHMAQRVAIKFLRPELVPNTAAVTRFLREAQTASAIQSEHVARMLDVAAMPTGELYLVMELLTGIDLGALVRKGGPLPISVAVDYVLQVCEAIAEAHAHDVIHRDLKPSNLFLTFRADGSPLVKVLDFGLAKPLTALTSDPSLTATGELVGTPGYMSPEQVRGLKDVDARSDIWALGAILHKLVTGRPPFDDDMAPAVLAKIVADPPERLRARRPDAPPGLEALVLRCLEKDRERRVRDVAELAEGLRRFASSASVVSIDRAVKVMSQRGRLSSFDVVTAAKMPPSSHADSPRGSSEGITVSSPPPEGLPWPSRANWLKVALVLLAGLTGFQSSVLVSKAVAPTQAATLVSGSFWRLSMAMERSIEALRPAPAPSLRVVTPGVRTPADLRARPAPALPVSVLIPAGRPPFEIPAGAAAAPAASNAPALRPQLAPTDARPDGSKDPL